MKKHLQLDFFCAMIIEYVIMFFYLYFYIFIIYITDRDRL